MKRLAALAIVAIPATAAIAFAAGPPADTTTPPTGPAQVDVVMVPQAKLVKAVRARDAARAEARALRATLRHSVSVREALTIAAVAYNVPRSELDQVAFCESRHVSTARNGRYRGLFQMGPLFEGTPYGRAGLSVWSPYASAMATAYTVRHGGRGWAPWECSPRGKFRP